MQKLTGIVGLLVIVAICTGLSRNRRAISWRLVAVGLALQLCLALLVLKTSPGRSLFGVMNATCNAMMGFSQEGSSFVFGKLTESSIPVETATRQASPAHAFVRVGAVFAFSVLPSVIFVSALMALTYHIGIMGRIVHLMAVVMKKTLRTSGAESLSAAANVFLGTTEAPLLIKPYLAFTTKSELLAIMVGGLANSSGEVLVAYVGMLSDRLPDIAGHLLAGSVMSAPASLVLAKLLIPETEKTVTSGDAQVKLEKVDVNAVDAFSRGASEGLPLALNIAATLIATIALVSMGNAIWGALCHGLGAVTGIDLTHVDTMQEVLGYLFAPFAYLMGIPPEDCLVAGKLLGEKTILNEFVAYAHLADYMHGKPGMDGVLIHPLTPRTEVILSYALCGFANLGSIGILVGGLGSLMPTRRSEIARLSMLALVGGTLSSFMTATFAGLVL